MTYTYDDTYTIRVAELKLLSLDEAKTIIAQVDSPSQACEMAAIHSDEATQWVKSVIKECNHIHDKLKETTNDFSS